MYRLFLRKKRVLPFLLFGMFLSSLAVLIFDGRSSEDQLDHDQFHPSELAIGQLLRNVYQSNTSSFKNSNSTTTNVKVIPLGQNQSDERLRSVEKKRSLQTALTRQATLIWPLRRNEEGRNKHVTKHQHTDKSLGWSGDQHKLLPMPPTRTNQSSIYPGKLVWKTLQEVGQPEWRILSNAGSLGSPVRIDTAQLSEQQRLEMKNGKERHFFNEFVSNRIPLNRSLSDVREPGCRSVRYRVDLPEASVVIIFHNEAWSTLLRTVHSVLDRSSPHLLSQVILVDDFSDMEHLKKPLDDYLSQLQQVMLVRAKAREGLVKARLLGLSYVTTSAVIFLDSHCECTEGWLEPMLDRIAADPTTVVVPVIDVIDEETFEYHHIPGSGVSVGTFTWSLFFSWMPIQPSEKRRRQSNIEPIRTPTMAGGLFAIDRDYFYKLGTYDPGIKIWGGENLELSFKIWMCGGTLEIIPCSHVGHVFRKTSPHSSGGFRNYLAINLRRLSAVWLDEYSFYSNQARRIKGTKMDIGDISARQELRQRLKCHSFAWYLKNVLPDEYLLADRIAHGQIQNKLYGLCITSQDIRIFLVKCKQGQNEKPKMYHSSQWYMNIGESTVFQENHHLEKTCLDYSGKGIVDNLHCHGLGGNQLWQYSQEHKQLYHNVSGLCAEVAGSNDSYELAMATCNHDNPRQQWLWDTSPVLGPSWRKDLAAGRPVL